MLALWLIGGAALWLGIGWWLGRGDSNPHAGFFALVWPFALVWRMVMKLRGKA